MPFKPPTPCASPRCPALSHDRFCEAHGTAFKKEMGKRYDETRPSASQRGYNWNWGKLRKLILHRDPICQTAGCTQATEEIDHRQPLSRGGTNTMQNLQGLCKSCHSKKTVRETFSQKV